MKQVATGEQATTLDKEILKKDLEENFAIAKR